MLVTSAARLHRKKKYAEKLPFALPLSLSLSLSRCQMFCSFHIHMYNSHKVKCVYFIFCCCRSLFAPIANEKLQQFIIFFGARSTHLVCIHTPHHQHSAGIHLPRVHHQHQNALMLLDGNGSDGKKNNGRNLYPK